MGRKRKEREKWKEKRGEEEAPASPRSPRNGDPTFNAGPNSPALPGRSGLSALSPRPLPRPRRPRSPAGPSLSPHSGAGPPPPPPARPRRPGAPPEGPARPPLTFAQLPLPHADDERRVLAVVDEPQAQGLHALLRVAQLRQLPLQRRLRERRHRCTASGPAAPSRPGRAALSPRLSASTREEPTSDSQPFPPRRQRPAPTKWRRPRPVGSCAAPPPPRLPSLPAERELALGRGGNGIPQEWSQSVSVLLWKIT